MAEESDQTVTPFVATTKSTFNYKKLTEEFGLDLITDDLLNRLQKVTGCEINHLLYRQIFFCHQDFTKIIEAKEQGKEIYIYTGRGPSAEALHFGHFIPMEFTVWLQTIFDCWVVIEMADEEKFYFKDGTLDEFIGYTENNTKDIIACGFNRDKTFIFKVSNYKQYMVPLVDIINKKMSVHVTNKVYGFDDKYNIGQLGWPSYEMAPALCGAFPHLFGDRKDIMCLVACAIDQVPYFRITRQIAESLGYPKPALICAKFLVGLQGVGDKASSTSVVPPLFLNDTDKQIKDKINKYAFSGGRNTIEEHRKLGGNLEVDVPYIYLNHFLKSDTELKIIAEEYSSGKMLSGEIKQKLINNIIRLLNVHRSVRSSITKDDYDEFFTMKVQKSAKEYFDYYVEKYVKIKIAYE